MLSESTYTAQGKPRLPYNQLMILSLARFAEPISFAGVLPYLPSYIENLGVPKNDVAWWAGLASFLFSFCQCLTAISWGRLSDRVGRKPTIMICLLSTGVFSLAWGFSTTLPAAMISRGLLGALNGNVGILRTVVAELVPWKELQPMAFAIMPSLYNIGFVIGPMVSGLAANPYHVQPGEPHGNKLLERFPFALPNIIAAAVFFASFMLVLLGFQETLAAKRDRCDYGILLKTCITKYVSVLVSAVRSCFSRNEEESEDLGAREPLLSEASKSRSDEEAVGNGSKKDIEDAKPAPWRDVFTAQCVNCMLAYSLLALHSGAYDLILPVFMHRDPSEPTNYLKFTGGFASSERTIGFLFTIYGAFTCPAQIFLFPWITHHVGALRCLKITAAMYPIIFFLTPLTALLPGTLAKEVVATILFVFKGYGVTFGYPCTTILLTQSAKSMRTLATLNGVLTVTSAIARAVAGGAGGAIFTFGVKRGFVIIPFWIIAIVSVLGLIPVFLIKEDDDSESKGKTPDSNQTGQEGDNE